MNLARRWENWWDRPEPASPSMQSWERFWADVHRAQRAGALVDENVRDAFKHWSYSPDDSFRASLAKQAVLQWHVVHEEFPFMPPRAEVIGRGEVLLGCTVPDGFEVRITREQACSHIAFLGGTGSGKSVWCYNLVLNTQDVFSARWVFDFYSKDRWRGLRHYIRDFVICPWRKACLNLLNPSDRLALEDVAGDVVDDISQTFEVRPHSRQYLRRALREARTVRELLAHLERAEYSYQDALVEKLEGLAEQFPQYRVGWPMRALLQTSILWELNGLDAEMQAFCISRLMRSAFREKTTSPSADSLLVVVDEGNRVFGSGSSLADLTSIVRAAGFAMVICFQSATGDHRISSLVVENAAVKLLGKTGGVDSLEVFGRSMALSREQVCWARKHLQPGLLLASHPDWREPFVMTCPNVDLPELGQDEVEESLAPLRCLPVEEDRPAVEVNAPNKEGLGDDERRFLRVVCERPFLNATALYRSISLSTRACVEIKDRLAAMGVVQPYEDRLAWSRRGRPKLYLEPTERAFELLGLECPSWGRGGYAHALYAHLIGARMEGEGFRVEYEHALSTGQFLDVFAKNCTRSLGVEVELSSRHADANLKKALHIDIDELWVVAPRDVLEKIKSEHETARVKWVPLGVAVSGPLPLQVPPDRNTTAPAL